MPALLGLGVWCRWFPSGEILVDPSKVNVGTSPYKTWSAWRSSWRLAFTALSGLFTALSVAEYYNAPFNADGVLIYQTALAVLVLGVGTAGLAAPSTTASSSAEGGASSFRLTAAVGRLTALILGGVLLASGGVKLLSMLTGGGFSGSLFVL